MRMSDHNLGNAINQCNKGYWNNEIDEKIVNHSSVLTASAEMFPSSLNNNLVINLRNSFQGKEQ